MIFSIKMGQNYSTITTMPNYDILASNTTCISKSENMIKNKLYHDDNEPIIATSSIFTKRLNDKLGDLFTGFDWSNTVLAGGFALSLVEKEELQEKYANSDIDIFVYAGEKEKLNEKMAYVLNYFDVKIKPTKYMQYAKSYTIDLVSSFNRNIQIIGVMYDTANEVLENFDLSHCQIGYNGTDIVYTEKFRQTMISRISQMTKDKIQGYRLVKTMDRGFMIDKLSESSILLNNYLSLSYTSTDQSLKNHYQQRILKLTDITMDDLNKSTTDRAINFDSHIKRVRESASGSFLTVSYEKLDLLISAMANMKVDSIKLR
jgi:hypothetical protein